MRIGLQSKQPRKLVWCLLCCASILHGPIRRGGSTLPPAQGSHWGAAERRTGVHTSLKKCKRCPPYSRCEEGDTLRGVGWWSCWKEVGGLSIELLLTSAGQEWLSPEAVQSCLDRWEECISNFQVHLLQAVCRVLFLGVFILCWLEFHYLWPWGKRKIPVSAQIFWWFSK